MFQRIKFEWVVILALLIWIVVQTCTEPQEPIENNQKYDSLLIIARQGELRALELSQQRRRDSVASVESKRVYEIKVKKLEGRISDLKKNPVIVRIRDEVKEVDSLIVAYDSTLLVKDARIAELETRLYDTQKIANQAEQNFESTLSAYRGANSELLEGNKDLRKQLRKERRQKRAAIILGILLGGAGIAL